MKLRDVFTKEFYEQYGDVDVVNDVTDEMCAAYCGTLLTEEGEEHFGDILELEVEMFHTDYWYLNLLVDDHDEESDAWEIRLNKAFDLFNAAAGYCSDSNYDKWFKDE